MANFYNLMVRSASTWPTLIAQEVKYSDGRYERFTFEQVRRMSESVARWIGANVPRGGRCAILAANGPRWVATYMGTLGAGCVTVPFDTALTAEQVAKLLRDSGASVLFTDDKNRAIAEKAANGTRIVDLQTVVLDAPLDPEFNPVDVKPDELAAILYSSGTTGDPKGVMLTHDNLLGETELIFDFVDLGPGDALLGILPLFHSLAQATNCLAPLAGGSRVVFLEALNSTELMRALKEDGITVFVCVPQFFYLIHDRVWGEVRKKGPTAQKAFNAMLALSRAGQRVGVNLGKVLFKKVHAVFGDKLRFFVTGGSRFDPQIGRDFQALGFTILQAYGLTETSGGATCMPFGEMDISSVGHALRGVELKIAPSDVIASGDRSESHGYPLGEICMRGRIVMKGYWNRPDATAAALDSEGWLHTGDLGYVDSKGLVHITGRAKDVIVLSSGKNVYPEEIEAHYTKSPIVKEICVLGIESKPGEPASERLHGVIVPNLDVLKERKVVNTREAIRYDIENLSTQVAPTKRILSYDVWLEDLPRTTTRKLKRFEIERRVREQALTAKEAEIDQPLTRQLTEADRAWLADSEVQAALVVIREMSKGDKKEILPTDNLELDLGLDSMERVELLVALERELGAHVDDSVVSQVYTVRELIEAVRASKGATGQRAETAAWDTVLATEPDDPQVLEVAEKHDVATRFWYMLSRFTNLIARDFLRLRVRGVEKLPKSGPFILAPNHQSFLDPPALIGALPWNIFKDMFYVGTSELFGDGHRSNAFMRRVGRSMRLVPVDPDANLMPAMRAGAFGLRRGKVLVLYPEGERSIDGTPKVFKKGAAILATHLQVPIVPVAMDGFYEAWPRGKRFQKFTRTRITFGDPIPPPSPGTSPEEAYDRLTAELRDRVMTMWQELHEELYGESQAVVQHG